MRRLVIALLGVLMASVAGIAAGSVLADPGAAPRKATAEDAAAAGGDRGRVEARAADPRDGPDWAVRSYTGGEGLSCLTASRVQGETFGPLVQGEVRSLPVDGSGSCADLVADGWQLLVGRFAATSDTKDRTIIFGRLGAKFSEAEYLGVDDVWAKLTVAPDSSFVLVREGLVAPGSIRVRVRGPGGASQEQRM